MLLCVGIRARAACRGSDRLRVENQLARWASEKRIQSIENISAQNSFMAGKVHLQPARVLLPVKLDPNPKCKRCRRSTGDTANQALPRPSLD